MLWKELFIFLIRGFQTFETSINLQIVNLTLLYFRDYQNTKYLKFYYFCSEIELKQYNFELVMIF